MKKVAEFSHRFGLEAVQQRGYYDEIRMMLEAPQIGMERGATSAIGLFFERQLCEHGWSLGPAVHPDYNLDINAIKGRIGLTMQTGNIARAIYDLMKFQVMHLSDRIEAAVLIVPTNGAASALGSNLANFGRITSELKLFQHVITVPTLVVGFDE